MLIDMNNLVSADDFRKQWDHYVAKANKGDGPIAVMEDAKLVGVFVGAKEFEQFYDDGIAQLLESRMKPEAKVSTADVRKSLKRTLAKFKKSK